MASVNGTVRRLHVVIAGTVANFLLDWRRGGWHYVIQHRPQYALDFVGTSVLGAIVFSIVAIRTLAARALALAREISRHNPHYRESRCGSDPQQASRLYFNFQPEEK